MPENEHIPETTTETEQPTRESDNSAAASKTGRQRRKDAHRDKIQAEVEVLDSSEQVSENVHPGNGSDISPEMLEPDIILKKDRLDKRKRMRKLCYAVIEDLDTGNPIGIYKVALNIGITRLVLYQWSKDDDWKYYQGIIDLVKKLSVQARIERAILHPEKGELSVLSYAMGYLQRLDPTISKSEQTIKTEKHDPRKLPSDKLMRLKRGEKPSEVLTDAQN